MKKNLFIVSVLLVLVVFPVFPMSTEADPGVDAKLVEVANTPDNPVPVAVVGVSPVIGHARIDKCESGSQCRALIYKVPRQSWWRLQYVSLRAAGVPPKEQIYTPFAMVQIEEPDGFRYEYMLGLLTYASKVYGQQKLQNMILGKNVNLDVPPESLVYVAVEVYPGGVDNIDITLSGILRPPFPLD